MLAVSSATSITYTLIVLLIIKKKFPSQTESILYKTNVYSPEANVIFTGKHLCCEPPFL